MVDFLKELLLQDIPAFIIQTDRVELFFHIVERSEKGMENVSMVLEKHELGKAFYSRI
jgi:hypothetical protein